MVLKNEKLAKLCCIFINICVVIWLFLKFHIELYKEVIYFIFLAVSASAVIWTFYPIQTMEFINDWMVTPIRAKVYTAIMLFIILESLMAMLFEKGIFARILNGNYLSRFYKVIKKDEHFEVIDREELRLRSAKIVAIVKNNYQRIEIGENEVAKKENGVISIYNKGDEQAKEIIPVKNTILFEWMDKNEKHK